MKKLTKALSSFLAIMVVLSAFGVSASAISSKSTPEEMLTYYEKALKKTSSKNLIKAAETYEYWDEYDLTGLKGEKLEKVKAETADKNTEKYTDNDEEFYFGDRYKDKYYSNKSQFCSYFSIKDELDSGLYELWSASYSKNSSGVETIVFKCGRGPEETPYKCNFTVKISKSGYVTYYAENRAGTYCEYSNDGYRYKLIQHTVEKYKFSFEKVPVKLIALSEKSVNIPYDESKEIIVTVNPSDATFKNYDIDIKGDRDAFYVEQTKNGVNVYACNDGKATLVVSSADGDVTAECELECKMTFFEKVSLFFETFAAYFRLVFFGFAF